MREDDSLYTCLSAFFLILGVGGFFVAQSLSDSGYVGKAAIVGVSGMISIMWSHTLSRGGGY